MLSFSQLSHSNPEVLHALVDSFFESKKALVVKRMHSAMENIVHGLFEEMVGQVKEMLLPPKAENNVQVKATMPVTVTPPVKAVTTLPAAKQPNCSMIFGTKSNPSASISAQPQQQPFSGLYKRMAEEDGSSSGTQSKKKQAITVELECDDTFDDDALFADDWELPTSDKPNENSNKQPKTSTNRKLVYAAPIFEIDIPDGEPLDFGKDYIGDSYLHFCPEEGCTKSFICPSKLKRHLLVHSKVKPYSCTFPGCSSQFSRKPGAIRHIKQVHLEKMAGNDGAENEGGRTEPPDPASYLTVDEQLL